MRITSSVLFALALVGCTRTGGDTADTAEVVANVDGDGDGFFAGEDCDDSDASVFPEAEELCNGIDDNCDDEVDNDPTDALTFTEDGDGDGFGSEGGATVTACDAPDGYAASADDCDDTRDDIYPDAAEADCTDPVDYNCDGSVGYADADSDGVPACEDCDDANADAAPGLDEVVYDGIDNDCDVLTLDDDLDEDGVLGADDCDDSDPDVNPDADEVAYDGIDNDCDETTLDDDLDGDGALGAEDCDDTDPTVNPSAAEDPYDGIDNDCDETTPDDDLDGDGVLGAEDCDDTDASALPGGTEVAYDGVDNDCDPSTLDDDFDNDGFLGAEDCNDNDPLVNPGEAEDPYDGVDNDCDATTLDDDLDSDGFLGAEDCNDNDPQVSPGQAEDPYDGVDNDCDATTPDDDLDGDGKNQAEDCDENDPQTYEGATEIWYDGKDQACDGGDDFDQDGDGAASNDFGGIDCADTDAGVQGCGLTSDTALESCSAIKAAKGDLPDGDYWIDPTGADAFEVSCDMTTDGGGWTIIEYAADVPLLNHGGAGGDSYRYMAEDFTTVLSTERILAIQAVSTEGKQTYVGICDHVIHYDYQAGNYGYAAGFRFIDGEETPSGQADYSPFDITVDPTTDLCETNDDVDRSTIFEISSVSVPVVNINLRDVGNANERYASELTKYPARLR